MVNQRNINILNAKYEEPYDKKEKNNWYYFYAGKNTAQKAKLLLLQHTVSIYPPQHLCHHLNVIIERVKYYQSFVSFSEGSVELC